MRSGGQSLPRFMLPMLITALVVSAGQLYVNGWIVPVANAKKLAIERTYLGKSTAGIALYRLFFRDTPTRSVAIESYDAEGRIGRNVCIEIYRDTIRPRVVERIDAPDMQWDSTAGRWQLRSAVRRTFHGDTITFERLRNVTAPFTITHEQLVRLQRSMAEMTFDEVKDQIETLRKGGKNTRSQEIAYLSEWSLPFANFIVVLIAIPFASVRRRGGIAAQIAAAMAISFVYIAFTLVGQAWGAASTWAPSSVAWSANVIFFLVGVVNLLRTRS